MDDILQDIKFTWRSLLGRPIFAATAILTLTLAIGINTTVFSLVNAVLLRPLPVLEPERLMSLYTSREDRVGGVTSYADLKDLREDNTVFTGLAGHSLAFANLSLDGRSELLVGEIATSNYFDVLGVRPHMGRFFLPEEEVVEGAAFVAILNHRFWQARFNADPTVLGQSIQLNGKRYTVVGITPEGFDGMMPGLSPDFWVPIMMAESVDSFGQIDTLPSLGNTKLERRGYRWLWVTGRLNDGVNQSQAQAQMDGLTERLSTEYPRSNENIRTTLIPTSDVRMNPDLDGIVESASLFLLVAVGIVLLVACINVAGMFLARSSARRREVALRLALGTSRWRLIRQLLMESVAVALAGGVGGLILSISATRFLATFQPRIPIKIQLNLDPDWRVFLFTFGLSFVTGVIFGLAPALQSTRTDLVLDLKGQHSDEGRGRWRILRSGLVAGQLALSLMLLIGAALLTRSFEAASRIDVGFQPDRFAIVVLNLEMYGYDESRGRSLFDQLQQRFRSLPGVEAVTTAERTPFSLNINTTALFPTQTPEQGARPLTVDTTRVGAEYFNAMQIPIVEGRAFGPQDRQDSPSVAVVSQALAKQFWPGESAIGKQVRSQAGRTIEIVGVSRDYKIRTVGETPRSYIHFSRQQAYAPYDGIVVRTNGAANSILPVLRQEIQSMDPELVPFIVTTLNSELDHSLMPVRTSAILLAMFGAFTVFLAAVGLYGIIAYSVARRTREIGVRVALGATPQQILRQIVFEGSKLIGLGVIAGVIGAAAVSQLIQSLLYGISNVDWLSFCAGTLILVLVGLAANLIPALLASKIDPIQALRTE